MNINMRLMSSVAVIATIGVLGACSNKDLTVDGSPYDNCMDVSQAGCDALKKVVVKNADSVPDWMLQLPAEDEAFYSAGTAVSRDMQLAIDKANLAAKRTLADRIGGELSSQIKEFVIESGDMYEGDIIVLDVERTTKNVMARINVAGYKPSKMEIYPLGTMYRVYALLEYPIGGANDILVEQIRKNRALYAHVRSSVAWQELETEVDAKRERDLEDAQVIIDTAGGANGEQYSRRRYFRTRREGS